MPQKTLARTEERNTASIAHEFGLFLAITFAEHLSINIVGPVISELKQEFTLSAMQAGMIGSSYGMARLIVDLPAGLLLHRLNPIAVIMTGTVLIAGGAIGCGIAPSFPVLIIGRLLGGLGASLCQFIVILFLANAASSTTRGRALGLRQGSSLLSGALAPILGGFIAVASGWRYIFFFSALSGVFAFFLAVIGRRQISSFAGTLADSAQGDGSRVAALHLTPPFFAIHFVSFAIILTLGSFRSTVIPLYGGDVLGLTPDVIGWALGIGVAIRVVVSVVAGSLSDRYGRTRVIVTGAFTVSLGLLSLGLARDALGYVLAIAVFSLGGFGNSVPTSLLADMVPPHDLTRTLAVNRFVGDIAITLGPIGLGWAVDRLGYTEASVVPIGLLLLGTLGLVLLVKEAR